MSAEGKREEDTGDYMEDVLQLIQDAEMILIGIGEEFDDRKMLRKYEGYTAVRQLLDGSEVEWLIPAFDRMFARDAGESRVHEVLEQLAGKISDKNYFVVSTSTNDSIRDVSWREGRLVMPCGGSRWKQCMHNCGYGLTEVTAGDWEAMEEFRKKLLSGQEMLEGNAPETGLGNCAGCGGPLILNNIYTEKYDENGYLEQWRAYTKWLQGTLNRRLLILELGVGMQCPSVIRWPFEKVAFYNQKASFYRVNETLYQLSEDLNGKAVGISQNAIDWLEFLC